MPVAPKPFELGHPRACLLSCHHTPQALPPPGSHLSFSALHALPLTRQSASAFNQPLSFDTSSVTTMGYIFYVRSPRVPLAPKP